MSQNENFNENKADYDTNLVKFRKYSVKTKSIKHS